MRFLLRLLGTGADDADRATAVIDSISTAQLRDLTFALAAVAVILIDVLLILVIVGADR